MNKHYCWQILLYGDISYKNSNTEDCVVHIDHNEKLLDQLIDIINDNMVRGKRYCIGLRFDIKIRSEVYFYLDILTILGVLKKYTKEGPIFYALNGD